MKIYTLALASLFAVTMNSLAAGRGTIQGTVVNWEERRPLMGANIVLEGTVLGTSTDVEGNFSLEGVPVGVYSLTVSLVGYERKVFRGISVEEETTAEIIVELSSVPIQTDPVVVTASKREQKLQEVPVSVSVLDAKELTFRNTISLEDAMRYVPGVHMTQGQINIRGSTGYSRGVGTRVLLLVDGLPLLSGDTGEIIWESLPVYHIDRVEIVKGAGSALYGSSALGGVVNVITKAIKEQPETRIWTYGGLYETPKYPSWRWTDGTRYFNGVSVNYAQGIEGWRLFAGVSRTADEGFKRNDSWRRYNGSIQIGYDFSPFESLTMLFSYLNQRRGNFLYWKSLDRALVPEDGQLYQQVGSNRWSLGAQFKQFLSGDFYYTVKTSLYRTKWEDNIVSTLDPDGDRSAANFLNTEIQTTYSGIEGHIVTFGAYGSYHTVSADTIFGKHSGYGLAAYAQDEWKVMEEIRLVLGARYDWQRLEGTADDGQVNPKLGATYLLDELSTLRFSVGRGFRAPSIAEVYTTTEAGGVIVQPNPSIRPERSWSYEVGGSTAFAENVFAEASVFQNEFWDLIEPTFGTDGKVRFQNVTRARVQGFEVGLSTSFFENLLFSEIGYTYMYPRDISKQDILRYRPRHLLYTSGRLAYGNVQLGIDYRFLSKVERIDEEFVTLGIIAQGDKRVPIHVTDLRLSVDWTFVDLPFVSSFHVNNLFGYHYVELIGNIAPIRNYVIALEANL